MRTLQLADRRPCWIVLRLQREGAREKEGYLLPVLSHFSCVQLFAASWTVALQAHLSVGILQQEYVTGLPCPSLLQGH